MVRSATSRPRSFPTVPTPSGEGALSLRAVFTVSRCVSSHSLSFPQTIFSSSS
jgi:hypothetical protein